MESKVNPFNTNKVEFKTVSIDDIPEIPLDTPQLPIGIINNVSDMTIGEEIFSDTGIIIIDEHLKEPNRKRMLSDLDVYSVDEMYFPGNDLVTRDFDKEIVKELFKFERISMLEPLSFDDKNLMKRIKLRNKNNRLQLVNKISKNRKKNKAAKITRKKNKK